MKKLKICFIVGDLPPAKCGIADYNLNLINNLLKYPDLEITVLTGKKPFEQQIKAENLKILYIIDSWNFKSKNQVTLALKKISPDIIHYQHPCHQFGKNLFQFFLPFFLKREFREIKIVTTHHEFSEAPWYARPWLYLLARFSDNLIFISERDFKLASKKIKLKNKNFTAIPIGSNITRKNFNADYLKEQKIRILGENKFLLGFFGFIDKNKGLETLIEAMHYLKIKEKKPYKLLIIGQLEEKNHYHQHINNLISNFFLDNNIKFTGYVPADKVSEYLNLIDVCVLPFKKGSSLRRGSLLAPLIHNVPVVTKKGEASDILKDEINIIFFHTLEDLIEKINKLYNDKGFYQKIKSETAFLSDNFSWTHIAQRHYEVYKRII